MVNPVANIRLWRERAEVDWFAHYVQAWLAFNAWYRHQWPTGQEWKVIHGVATTVNNVRSNIVPLLTANYAKNKAFQASISQLNHRLESSHVHNRGTRITYTNVDIGENPLLACNDHHYGITISAARAAIASHEATLTLSGTTAWSITHPTHDPAALELEPNFVALSGAAKQRVRVCYGGVAPRRVCNLLQAAQPLPGIAPTNDQVDCDSTIFFCNDQDLYVATVWTLYALRNVLFHGSITPNDAYNDLYGAAYRVLSQFNEFIV